VAGDFRPDFRGFSRNVPCPTDGSFGDIWDIGPALATSFIRHGTGGRAGSGEVARDAEAAKVTMLAQKRGDRMAEKRKSRAKSAILS
jgi:hypothetical protein